MNHLWLNAVALSLLKKCFSISPNHFQNQEYFFTNWMIYLLKMTWLCSRPELIQFPDFVKSSEFKSFKFWPYFFKKRSEQKQEEKNFHFQFFSNIIEAAYGSKVSFHEKIQSIRNINGWCMAILSFELFYGAKFEKNEKWLLVLKKWSDFDENQYGTSLG